jgi:hypothetical protein
LTAAGNATTRAVPGRRRFGGRFFVGLVGLAGLAGIIDFMATVTII